MTKYTHLDGPWAIGTSNGSDKGLIRVGVSRHLSHQLNCPLNSINARILLGEVASIGERKGIHGKN